MSSISDLSPVLVIRTPPPPPPFHIDLRSTSQGLYDVKLVAETMSISFKKGGKLGGNPSGELYNIRMVLKAAVWCI